MEKNTTIREESMIPVSVPFAFTGRGKQHQEGVSDSLPCGCQRMLMLRATQFQGRRAVNSSDF